MPKTHRLTLPAPIHAAALRGEVSMLLVRMKPQPAPGKDQYGRSRPDKHFWYPEKFNPLGIGIPVAQASSCRACPYAPGDLIACREPWAYNNFTRGQNAGFMYNEPESTLIKKYTEPASRMPLAACRLWFRVQSVEARRMIEVTEEEARACGFDSCTAADQLRQAWLAGGTGLGDWVWRLKVERTER